MSEELTYGDLILCRMYYVEGFEGSGDLSWMIDESEVEHQINCHASTLPESYRRLAALARELTAALQKKQDQINQADYDAIIASQKSNPKISD